MLIHVILNYFCNIYFQVNIFQTHSFVLCEYDKKYFDYTIMLCCVNSDSTILCQNEKYISWLHVLCKLLTALFYARMKNTYLDYTCCLDRHTTVTSVVLRCKIICNFYF